MVREDNFQFSVVEERVDPCLNDYLNSINFADDLCGEEFGENTLAVALMSYESQVLGPSRLLKATLL